MSQNQPPAEIVGQLAHELRQPLSAMEAIAYYLLLTVTEDTRTRAQVEKLQQLIERTSWILSGAVHYVQAAPPRPEWRRMEPLLESAILDLTAEEQEAISLSTPADLPPVRLDLSQAQHMLSTALHFCLQSNRGTAPVVVRCGVDGSELRTVFAVPAQAIEGQPLDTMFAPFQTHPAAAAGLGLASVRRIAEAHGGSCHLHPDAAGSCELELRLPLSGSDQAS